MKYGKVIGTIWATRKDDRLRGLKLLVLQPLNMYDDSAEESPLIAADIIGAGEGEKVIYVGGSSARGAAGSIETPVDATVIGIVDDLEIAVSDKKAGA